jgi:DeoR/GlpR family transcriptional regulator of sugar metabolism
MSTITNKRRDEILEYISNNQSVKVAELSSNLGVSEVSIRRDLQHLEDLGKLKRVYGGAIAVSTPTFGGLHNSRTAWQRAKKERIGKAAAELIQKGDRIILDSGTTTLQVARNICSDILISGNLTVITASISILAEIGSCPGVHLIMLGGIYLPEYQVLVGPQTVEQLKGLYVDKMFLGSDGLTFSNGITTANVLEAEVDRAMVNMASEIIAVVDSSKIDSIGLVTIMPLINLSKLITDTDAPVDFVTELRGYGVDVLLV